MPSRRSTMNSAEIGMTTKNMPKISQAGTFCCTAEGRAAARVADDLDAQAQRRA